MDYFLNSLLRILQLIILAVSYNLVLGYTGMVHVGHLAFMAIGAYTSALMNLAGIPFWISGLSGVMAATLAGLLLALPTVRFRDDYLVAATLGMGEITRLILLNEREITGGSQGLPGIARPIIFGFEFSSNISLLMLLSVVSILVLLLVWKIVKSPFGKSLESIREDEIASRSLGINTTFKKIQILAIAAGIAGLSGVMTAHVIQYIDPDLFGIPYMVFTLLCVVLGGTGTFWAPIVGTTIIYSIFESMRFIPFPAHVLGPLRWMVFSVLLIALIIYKPTGIMGRKFIKKKL